MDITLKIFLFLTKSFDRHNQYALSLLKLRIINFKQSELNNQLR
jgi:hypothetical protein